MLGRDRCLRSFFFQAEDGIRDLTVTGVQTCALPICTLADNVRDARCWNEDVIRPLAIPLAPEGGTVILFGNLCPDGAVLKQSAASPDRKSTRLNSSHSQISYAVFCLKKKKTMLPDLA